MTDRLCVRPHIYMSQCVATGSVHDPPGQRGRPAPRVMDAVAQRRPTILLSTGNGVYKLDSRHNSGMTSSRRPAAGGTLQLN